LHAKGNENSKSEISNLKLEIKLSKAFSRAFVSQKKPTASKLFTALGFFIG